jgi:hypothetical protein
MASGSAINERRLRQPIDPSKGIYAADTPHGALADKLGYCRRVLLLQLQCNGQMIRKMVTERDV